MTLARNSQDQTGLKLLAVVGFGLVLLTLIEVCPAFAWVVLLFV